MEEWGGGGLGRGRSDGEEEGRGAPGCDSQGPGLHTCPSCHLDLGDTRELYDHMERGGGRCLLAMGLTLAQFKRQIRLKQMKLRHRRQVGHSWSNIGCRTMFRIVGQFESHLKL